MMDDMRYDSKIVKASAVIAILVILFVFVKGGERFLTFLFVSRIAADIGARLIPTIGETGVHLICVIGSMLKVVLVLLGIGGGTMFASITMFRVLQNDMEDLELEEGNE